MALHKRDVGKLLDHGIVIVRADYQRLKIKHKTKTQREWKDLNESFTSKAALNRRMDDLLECDTIIND